MSTISIRFINEDDVKRWERLEARGKLGTRQRQQLEDWRRTHGNLACNVVGRALLENARQQLKDDHPMIAWVCQNCGTIIHARQCPTECKTCGRRSNNNGNA